MLLDRSCKPGDEDILFHYCSPEAFLGLTQKRHLWFSDALSMNDSMELKWGYSIYEEARNELSGQIKMEFFLEVEKVFYTTAHGALPLVCCFSLDGDVLSQWRAYAQDGRGFAVGFSAKELMNMPARFLKVLYNREQQVDEMKAILQRI